VIRTPNNDTDKLAALALAKRLDAVDELAKLTGDIRVAIASLELVVGIIRDDVKEAQRERMGIKAEVGSLLIETAKNPAALTMLQGSIAKIEVALSKVEVAVNGLQRERDQLVGAGKLGAVIMEKAPAVLMGAGAVGAAWAAAKAGLF